MIALAALLLAGGLFLIWSGLRARRAQNVHNLREVLEITYDEGPRDMSAHEVSQLLARAGAVAERALDRTGLMARLVTRIERSDYSVRPGEFVAITLGIAAAGFLMGLLAQSLPLAVLLGGIGLVSPIAYVNRSVGKRRSNFEAQFPDVLDLVAASLQSGSSMAQALEMVVAEADEPAAGEFSRVLNATRLGMPLIDALKVMAERMGSRDLDWTVQAIVVQQRTGGRLADILHTVAEFMRGREEVRREVKALSAEGRLSAVVLGALPFALAGMILVMNPDYLNPLFTTIYGWVMLAGSGLMLAIGFFVMSRMVKIEV
jgi:tight adherence protein B